MHLIVKGVFSYFMPHMLKLYLSCYWLYKITNIYIFQNIALKWQCGCHMDKLKKAGDYGGNQKL